ncbi:hypothetical protein [Novosphingobium sp.]|uniref:hypothetical protein n=1 Tax=Novosphingobium sp. TaxID=1874826 RepID=UPI00286E34F2|nr:hypothetical protein [Novosphingobium sp.]
MTGDMLVSLAALTACGFLAWRSFGSYRKSRRETAIMAAAWVGIFVALVFVLKQLGVEQ